MDGSGNTSAEVLFSTNCSTKFYKLDEKATSLWDNFKTNSKKLQTKKSRHRSQEVKKQKVPEEMKNGI